MRMATFRREPLLHQISASSQQRLLRCLRYVEHIIAITPKTVPLLRVCTTSSKPETLKPFDAAPGETFCGEVPGEWRTRENAKLTMPKRLDIGIALALDNRIQFFEKTILQDETDDRYLCCSEL